ncbi:hypothetical protein FRACYDRAFT_248548 [Fragilariopsis cylindrus CCMP1102]|uniref:VOC domain-containing protein n=1 Tax=Fragilariopsis cylindrus CCMP1102 TaxID=635003 RepID=A0A1E7ETU5_9STRA|nr:hypothetical protein FRACYDRAFT_248548 [Fragilariopsis cylindrus CCMP1102]|eukprot:OEU09214.1 hypothetical protein FRACYDRAFT_248548 [Fragilariopsis cylindrus CCMP1102]
MTITEENDEVALMVTDPWGTNFRIVEEYKRNERDNRGNQPGEQLEGIGISYLIIHGPINCNLDGISRSYRNILGAGLVEGGDEDDENNDDAHQEKDRKMKMKKDRQREKSSSTTTVGNYGIYISIYVADLPSCYQRANEIGVTYVNKRFSRQAYTIDDAIDQ